MPQRGQSAGRPGSALLILGAIFATALLFRFPQRPAPPVEHVARVSIVTATPLELWSPLPLTSMDRPSTASPLTPRPAKSAPPGELESIQTVVAVQNETPRADPAPRNAIAEPVAEIAPEPALVATAHGHMSGLAVPVASVSIADGDSGSNPFSVVGGAVGTAFVKTGAAISLAFKKTGQGILAPF